MNTRWAQRAVTRLSGRLTEAGMTTAEYAVGTLAAVAFAVSLIAVARSDAVRATLARLVQTALGAGG